MLIICDFFPGILFVRSDNFHNSYNSCYFSFAYLKGLSKHHVLALISWRTLAVPKEPMFLSEVTPLFHKIWTELCIF